MQLKPLTSSNLRPSTVVLRPSGCLDSARSPAFRQSLEQALDLATDTVVVDLVSVNVIKAEGIRSLMAGMKQAAALGKTLSLEFVDAVTRMILEEQLQDLT
ncbi:MAG: STAS domain-containing protein [Coleofasciculus sp. C1-SOL-03]|uniref:STAS domain-containing protein n=1 Tax=Coleofasciculus sp. C1-SOL-03 TaxID=3069522 RepID=UPI0032F716DD